MGAISLYAKASPDFAQKLARSQALLKSAAASYSPLTQASSLGAEDMAVTHLLEEAGIDSRTFVLDTGMLHAETIAPIPRIEERYLRHVDVYCPDWMRPAPLYRPTEATRWTKAWNCARPRWSCSSAPRRPSAWAAFPIRA